MKLFIHIFVIAALFVVLTGCGLKSKDETSHPLFKRAVKAQESKELELAIKYFNRYLALKPESSITHLRLASIYDESLDKPLRAVYHYDRFLEFAPNSPESGNVKRWRDAALRKYYFRTRRKFNDPEDVSVLQNTLYLTEQELKKNKLELKKIKSIQKKLIQYARETRDSEKILKARLSSLQEVHNQTLEEMKKLREELKEKPVPAENKKEDAKEDAKKAEKDVKKEEKKPSHPESPEKVEKTEKTDKKEAEKTVEPEKKIVKQEENKEEKKDKKEDKKEDKSESKSPPIIPKAVPIAPPFIAKEVDKPELKTDKPEIKIDKPETKTVVVERTYTVERGDSLSSISRKFYGSSRYYKRIFEANRDIIPSEKALRPGQVLKIPRL